MIRLKDIVFGLLSGFWAGLCASMAGVAVAALIAMAAVACSPAPEELATIQGAVTPGVCDPYDDNVGATPSNAVDVIDVYGLGVRFATIDPETAWDLFSPFDHATAGSNEWIWICEQRTHDTVTKPCRHNANYSSTYESTGVPGPTWI